MLYNAASPENKSKIVKFAIISNILEWYEFCIYAFLATIIGKLFFNSPSHAISLIYTFFIFTVGYIVRPLGSLFFGYIADKYSRVLSLQISTLTMSIPTLLIGMLPTYEVLGSLSIGLLILLRLMQGFAAGGELPTSACIVYEASDVRKRGLFCSTVSLSTLIGILLGSLTVTFLFLLLTEENMLAWGWRIPFLFGFPITLAILIMRKKLLPKNLISNKEEKFITSNKIPYKKILCALFLVGFMQICFYLHYIWMPSYLTVFLHKPQNESHILNLIALTSLGVWTIIFGYLSTKISKKFILAFSIIGMMVVQYPIFLILSSESFYHLILITFLLSAMQGGISSVIFVYLGDLFEKNVRCLSMSISYSCAASFLGGTAPTICSYFINKTGNLMFPAFFIIAASILALTIIIKSD